MADKGTHIFGLSPFSVAVIGIVSAAAVLMAYHLIMARWCNQREDIIRQQPQQFAMSTLLDIPSSLENSITDLLPSYKYNKDIGLLSKTEDVTCAVCLCEFKDGEPVRVLPECLHAFHMPCIDIWLHSHSSCPLCRTDMTPPRQFLGRGQELDTLRRPDANQPLETT